MYVIIVYDVAEARVAKVCKFLRSYLNWIQNSVFEGELTESELLKVKLGIAKLIDEKEDSVLIYKFRSKKAFEKEVIGKEKVETSNIL